MTELLLSSLQATNADPLHRLGVALSDPVRRAILLRLTASAAYPAELADHCATSRSNMSNHLACLRGCGLVVAEREGRQMRYELVSQDFRDALVLLTSVSLAPTCDHA